MDINEKYHFLHTIFQLRKQEDLVLYSRILEIPAEEEDLVNDLLEEEYRKESLNYPFTAPAYEPAAALWAAKALYNIAQLVLYREHKEKDLAALIPRFAGTLNPGVILSADLCLRFLPQIKREVHHIDPDDILIRIIEDLLQTWHYSGIGDDRDPEQPDLGPVFADPCLEQMYTDRIIGKKDRKRAILPGIQDRVQAALGIHHNFFWQALG